ncbi:MAG: prolipoprotein diacylglyceryl transferase [Proteobacteria bacterium]|nr:prolipoprotein diacylglyceryl transferase [Pseudomonadota bacterium]
MLLSLAQLALDAAALPATHAAHQPIVWADLGLRRGIAIGPFMLRYYSLAYLAGILFAYWHLSRMVRLPGAPLAQRHVDDLFFWCTVGIIAGGRLGYALVYTGGGTGIPSLFTHFTPTETVSWDLLRLWDGGMSFHGGFLGVVAAIAWVCWRNGLNFLRVGDYISPCAPLGLLFGRIANFINGELWGREAGPDVPWAMIFPGAGAMPRHPSQLYEALLEGLVLAMVLIPLFWKTALRFRPGLLAGCFPLGYGLARFVVEYYREPDAQLEEFTRATHLSMGQWLCLPMIAVGLFFVVRGMVRSPLGQATARG